MIIALFGPSCTGKTTLARRLRKFLRFPIRSCGEVVKSRAGFLGVVGMLDDDEHREVDAETRAWVVGNRPCVVEGRYLDYVLAPLGNDITLVQLDAVIEDRRQRREALIGHPLTTADFQEEEKADLAFSACMYSIEARLAPSLVLNSSELSVEACAQRIKSLVDGLLAPPG